MSVKTTTGEMQNPSSRPVNQRQHGSKRTRATLVRLSDDEHALLSAAAQRAGCRLLGIWRSRHRRRRGGPARRDRRRPSRCKS